MAESENLDPYKPPKIGNFILVGFPQTETHCQKLKEYGIEFDRVVYLTVTDTEENDPAKLLGDREREADEQEDCLYDWETEAARCAKISEQVKEMLGEENQDSIKEVDCAGDGDRVFINIRRELDPFFLKADN
jgi:adenylate kinase family enzyme